MKNRNQPCSARLLAGGILALGCALFAGCATKTALAPVPAKPVPVAAGEREPIDASWMKPSTAEFTLGPGDRLAIKVAGESSTEVETVVGPDGKIYYEMLDGIDVWGRTLLQTREALEKSLSAYYREQPHVNLRLLEVGSKRVWVLGRVASAGLYPLNGPTTLLDAISAAGGPAAGQSVAQLSTGGSVTLENPGSNAGDLTQAFVVRGGHPLPVNLRKLLQEGDMTQNIYVQPDDLIYLPSPHPADIYVLGAVNQPRAVRVPGQPTLISAIASAGGTAHDAYLTNVAVVRGGVTDPAIAVYDYKAIVNGKAPDVRLEPNDIVYVPLTPYHVLTRYADLIVTTFVRTIGVNAGARAAGVEHGTIIGLPITP